MSLTAIQRSGRGAFWRLGFGFYRAAPLKCVSTFNMTSSIINHSHIYLRFGSILVSIYLLLLIIFGLHMFNSYDGYKNKEPALYSFQEVPQKEDFSNNFDSEENTTIKNGFLGFEKIPIVLLKEMNDSDISKYKLSLAIESSAKIDNLIASKYPVHYARLKDKCIVNLARDNFNKFFETHHKIDRHESSMMGNFKCKICDKGYKTEKKLLKHQANKHMIVNKPEYVKAQKRVSFSDNIIVHEVKEYHKCRKCSKIFQDYKNLKVHMKKQHKKRNCYICNYCSKKFVDRMFFKVHIKSHCDTLLLSKLNPLKHKRSRKIRSKKISLLMKKILNSLKDKGKVPEFLLPSIVLKKIDSPDTDNSFEESTFLTVEIIEEDRPLILKHNDVDLEVQTSDFLTGKAKKAVVNPFTKKTIISKHQCKICGKFYSSNYCLNRHAEQVHQNTNHLQCDVCEETFVWQSLLQSHRCIRLNIPEMPFDDARPEIYFDNMDQSNSVNDFLGQENGDYANSIDFEIPEPIVELNEYESNFGSNILCNGKTNMFNDMMQHSQLSQNKSYKVVMQEVPIEF